MVEVKTLIMRAPGINCDEETAFAFARAGSVTELVHINQLVSGERQLADYQILAFPGGFSYGDDLGAGKVQANEFIARLGDDMEAFIDRGGLVIGICNGFQVLVKAGILPGPMCEGQSVTLTTNDSGRFECRWVNLAVNPSSRCIFTTGIERMYLPVAHGEGKLVAPPDVVDRLNVALFYADAAGRQRTDYPDCPSGSMRAIAGLTDATGRIFALMPHPERYISPSQNPRWPSAGLTGSGDGLKIFLNAVDWVRKT